MSDTLLLVAAPGLFGKQHPQKLDQVLKLPLLHSSENWAAWISSMPGIDAPLHRL
jgi:hypothetical protein